MILVSTGLLSVPKGIYPSHSCWQHSGYGNTESTATLPYPSLSSAAPPLDYLFHYAPQNSSSLCSLTSPITLLKVLGVWNILLLVSKYVCIYQGYLSKVSHKHQQLKTEIYHLIFPQATSLNSRLCSD